MQKCLINYIVHGSYNFGGVRLVRESYFVQTCDENGTTSEQRCTQMMWPAESLSPFPLGQHPLSTCWAPGSMSYKGIFLCFRHAVHNANLHCAAPQPLAP